MANRIRLLLGSIVAICLAGSAIAQDWPVRPVRVVIPYPQGRPSDVATRIVFEKVAAILGQPVVLENRSGASGANGAEHARKAPPDGYTFLTTTAPMLTITPHLRALPYKLDRDFIAVARMATSIGMFAVHPEVPANNVGEFIAYARAHPGKVKFGSAGTGTITQLQGEALKLEAAIDIVHVPFQGSEPALQALLAGQVQAQFDTVVLPQVRAARLRGLAILGDARWPAMPGIPTLREQGFLKEAADTWFGILAPTGTPAPIVAKLARAIEEALRTPQIVLKLELAGMWPTYLDPQAFRARIGAESMTFAESIRRGNITMP